ncbi:hypothetical protein JX266_011339 [Neoarthrinium moseri]|nr:hypothetical protein JX266_011339 [Neoarthrinium moseri]
MVFPGRFSTGCRRCRQRKVKCDESKPACRRCYIYGKPCPGYTDQFHFRFDKSASKQERASPAQHCSKEVRVSCQPQPQSAQTSGDQAMLAPSRPAAIIPHPELSYEDMSLCYFVRRFVTPDEADNFPGHLSFLPALYNPHGHGVLEAATLSVAQMAAYNQFGGDKFRLQSYQNYGRAVRALRNTIQNEEEVTSDKVIAADISGEGWGNPSEHAAGLYCLLEKRGVEQLCTSRGFELFLLALLRLQVHSFLNEDDSYSDPGGLVALLSLFDPLMRAMSLMTKVLWLRHNLSKSPTSPDTSCEPSEHPFQSVREVGFEALNASILQACFEALDEFDTWDFDAESYWKLTFEGRSVPAALGEVATKANYYDPETACTIILVRSARLVLLLSILEFHDRTQVLSNNDGSGTGCIIVLEQSIRLTIADMLWCVPFAMGDLDPNGQSVTMPHDGAAALTILQPLKLVTYCPYATHEQRKSVQGILDRMNLAIGVRSAVSWEERAGLKTAFPGTQGLIRAMTSLASGASSQAAERA